MKTALIALSGGVDSSVAAQLTAADGYRCVGVTLKLHPDQKEVYGEKCGSESAVQDAKQVAEKMGMEFSVLDASSEFEKYVVNDFVVSYESGATPNPCIECNRHLKFGVLHRKARELGCEKVVTGHYARVEYSGERYLLKRAKDSSKDQSYVLYFLSQEQLAHTLFPLGEKESKEQVRRLAQELGFCNAEKAESQDICFVPDGDYAAFISRYTGKRYLQGDFVDIEGKVLGRHKGLLGYTIGQRKGLGLALSCPGYVVEKRLESNEIVVAPREYLSVGSLEVGQTNWIAFDAPPASFRAEVATRYQAPVVWATVIVKDNTTVTVLFDEPHKRTAKGQSVVFYDGDAVIGGGKAL